MRDERLLLALVLAGAVSCKGGAGNASTTGSAAGGSAPGSGTAAAAPGAGTASAAPAPPAPPAPAPAGKPIRASLIEAAGGKPVLLALDGTGQLVARTVDGGVSRVL